jgi:hypothetical protein
MIGGLALAFVDLIFWIWFVVYAILTPQSDIFGEGLFVVMMIHFPSSIVLPLLWITIGQFLDGALSIFFPAGQLLSQFLIVFTAGIIQYFLIGYLLGLVVLFFKKKLGKPEDGKKLEAEKEIVIDGKTNKVKMVFVNFAYLIFGLPICLIIYEYAHDIFSDFARFKMMHPASNILIYLAVIFLWGASSFYVYKINKKAFKEDKWNLVYTFMPLLVVLITWMFIN